MADNNSDTNLIINYLPQSLTDDEFRSMFLSIGPIRSCKVIRDRATGYSYGFGFVDYSNITDAERAIQTLNGLQLQNKTIKVALARQGEDIKGANLYVRNMPRTLDEDDMHVMFAEFGDIVQCRILRDNNSGGSKGVGFVLFSKSCEAEEAIAGLSGKIPHGATEPLTVKHAEDNRGKARPPVVVVANRSGYGGGNYGGGYGPGPMRSNTTQSGRYRYNPVSGNYNQSPSSGMTVTDEGYVLYIYNVGPDGDERALWQLFSPFGTVQKVNVIRDYQKNQCKGYGFVTMTNYHESLNAIQGLNGYRYMGRQLQVSFKTSKV